MQALTNPVYNTLDFNACGALKQRIYYVSLYLLGFFPACSWVKYRDCCCDGFRIFTQIILVDHAIVIDKKARDSRCAVTCRIRDDSKPADHLAFNQVMSRTVRCVFSLAGQNAVVVTVIGLAPQHAWARISLIGSGGKQRTERTRRFVRLGRPIQSVAFARAAGEPRRIDRNTAAIGVPRRILAFRIDNRQAHLHRLEFVAADSPLEYFILALDRVEAPAVWMLDQRDRHRPFVLSDDEGRLRFAFKHHFVGLVVGFAEHHTAVPWSPCTSPR